jgi:ABC-type nitrate/sulfonate/bicarbonate transport system permease component
MPIHPYRRTLLGVIGTIGFFLIWEAISRSGQVNTVMLPAPTTIIKQGWLLLQDGELISHLLASLRRTALGFVFGTIPAIVLGVAMVRMPALYELLNPLMQMFRSVPALAFVPLAIFWFGIGETSKVFLIAWAVFFPLWISTYFGVRDVNPLFLRASASLGASGWRQLVFVLLPAALPHVLSGIRISISIAVVILVAAELSGASFGIGYLIQESAQVFRVDQMFVGIVTLGLMGFAINWVFDALVAYGLPWYGAEQRMNSRRDARG